MIRLVAQNGDNAIPDTWYFNDGTTAIHPAGIYNYDLRISNYKFINEPAPTAFFWGDGQTSRNQDAQNRAAADFVGDYLRLSFNGNDPDEELYGAEGLHADFGMLDSADVSSDADTITGETSIPDNAVLRLTAGSWKLRFRGEFSQIDNPDFNVWLFQIGSGTDSSVIIDAPGSNRGIANPFDSAARLIGLVSEFETRITLTETTQFTLVAGTFESLGTEAQRDMSFYLECEREF